MVHLNGTEMDLNPERIRHVLSLVQQQYPGWSGFSDPRFQENEVHYKRSAFAQARDILSQSELHRVGGPCANTGSMVARLTVGPLP